MSRNTHNTTYGVFYILPREHLQATSVLTECSCPDSSGCSDFGVPGTLFITGAGRRPEIWESLTPPQELALGSSHVLYCDIYPVNCTKFLQVSSGKMTVVWQTSKQKNKTRNVYMSHQSLKNTLIHPTDGSENIHGRQMEFCMPKDFKPWKTIREESPKLPGEARVGRVTMMWSISRTVQTTVKRGTYFSGTICTTNKDLKLPDLLADPRSSMKSQ